MKMKKSLFVMFVVLWLLVLTMGTFKGFCADREAKQTPVKKAWESNSRFSADPGVYHKFFNDLDKRIKEKKNRGEVWHKEITAFKNLIDSDPIVRMYITKMIEQSHYGDMEINPYLKDVDDMLNQIDAVLERAPIYEDSGLVGFPINAILIDAMATPAGYAAFRDEKINKHFKEIINAWADYLKDEKGDSKNVIKDSWNCDEAKKKLNMEQYKNYDKADPYWGYKSWNDFFIRELKPGQRKIDGLTNGTDNTKIIVSACDSGVFQIQRNVQKSDRFWIKSQLYSLADMFDIEMLPQVGKFIVDDFVGGDVYQAFLCAYDYHRWHSPVSGKVIAAYNIPGTYYSQAEAVGKDPSGPDLSQGYIAHTAARAMIVIEADGYKSGSNLVAVMPVGMAEVSSCVINKKFENIPPDGVSVAKGEELGYFQYGGSTYCLIFQKGVIKEFTLKKDDNGKYVKVLMGQQIALAN